MKDLNKPRIHGIGKIGPKGQVVIPAEARAEFSLDPGERVVFMSVPHKKGLIIVSEDVFNKQLEHMKEHFGGLYDYIEKRKNQLKDNLNDV